MFLYAAAVLICYSCTTTSSVPNKACNISLVFELCAEGETFVVTYRVATQKTKECAAKSAINFHLNAQNKQVTTTTTKNLSTRKTQHPLHQHICLSHLVDLEQLAPLLSTMAADYITSATQTMMLVRSIAAHLAAEPNLPAAENLTRGEVDAWIRALNTGIHGRVIDMLALPVLECLLYMR